MAEPSRTPHTEQVLHVQGNVAEARIRKTTKGHEILDVDGFTLKRRKTQGPLAGAPGEAEQPIKTPHSQMQRGGGSATGSRSPYVDEYEISEELFHRLSRSLEALPEAASAAERLAAVCSAVCDAEVDLAAKAGGGVAAAALAEVFAAFTQSLAGAAQEGAIRFAAQPPPAFRVDEADLKVDLQARKAGLRARLQKFQEEEAEWGALLSKVEALDVNPGGAAAEGAAEEDEGDGGAAAPPSAEVAALRRLQRDVHRRLALQVDGVCLLVGDVEELVERANREAGEMQARYHAQRFQTFPHVNSPAHLIKALVRPAAAAAAAAGQGES